jgi:hypothetical protein
MHMADRKKDTEQSQEPQLITMTNDEFGPACQRIHSQLVSRMKKLKVKHDRGTATQDDFVEASKDVFAFVHLMELVEAMTDEIAQLRSLAEANGFVEEEERVIGISSLVPTKKSYLN